MDQQQRDLLLDSIAHHRKTIEQYRRLEREYGDSELKGNMADLAEQMQGLLDRQIAEFSRSFPGEDIDQVLAGR